MENKEIKRFRILPCEILYSKNLSNGSKLLFAEIKGMCSQSNFCWARNQTLANIFGINVSSIKRWLKELESENLIEFQTSYSNSVNGGKVRKILIVEDKLKNEPKLAQKRTLVSSKMSLSELKNEPYKSIIEEKKEDIYKECFEKFRKAYPGSNNKRGLETEYKNFKKHTDWKETLPKLLPSIKAEMKFKEAKDAKGIWRYPYKMMKTWINQRCWETEHEEELYSDNGIANLIKQKQAING